MDWLTKCRKDVVELMEKAVVALPDPQWRELRWKVAALPGPTAEAAEPGASPMHALRIQKWQAELQRKLKRLEAVDRAKGAIPGARDELVLLGEECDELAQLIEEAEEQAPAPVVRGRKSVDTVELHGSVPFTGGR